MHCADLDRYLEAHLDGRLGRARVAALRRHLGACSGCRRRVAILDAFSREVGERVCGRRFEAVWSTLLVADEQGAALVPPRALALPPPPPPHPVLRRGPAVDRRAPPTPTPAATARPLASRASRVARRVLGMLVLAAALGALVELLTSALVGTPAPADGPLLRPPSEDSMPALHIRTGDPARLMRWLEHSLGGPYPVPPPPLGYELLGARGEQVDGTAVAAIVYRRPPELLTLYVTRGDGTLDRAVGPGALLWSGGAYRFGLAGTTRRQDLDAIRDATMMVPTGAPARVD